MSEIAFKFYSIQLIKCLNCLVQQAFAEGQTRKLVDDLLNDSLRILDICGIAQNALLQIKESVQGLLSVLRRRGAGGGVVVGGVGFGRHGQQMLLSVKEEHVKRGLSGHLGFVWILVVPYLRAKDYIIAKRLVIVFQDNPAKKNSKRGRRNTNELSLKLWMLHCQNFLGTRQANLTTPKT